MSEQGDSTKMDVVHAAIDEYLDRLSKIEDPVVREMEDLAARRLFPIVGPQVGRLLELLVRVRGASRVFELGSGFGYSTFWFSRSLPADGWIVFTEKSEENVELARDFLTRLGYERHVRFHAGDALEVLAGTSDPFDIYFLDIDKDQYPAAYCAIFERMRTGDLLIADNVIWDGRVVTDPEGEASTRGIVEFTAMAMDESELDLSVLPVRDGLLVARKR